MVNPGRSRPRPLRASTHRAQSSPPMTLTVSAASSSVAGSIRICFRAGTSPLKSSVLVLCPSAPSGLNHRLVGPAGERVGAARCGHTVNQVVDATEPRSDQVQDLLFCGVGEGVAVEEGEVAADLGGQLGGRDRAIPARGGRAALGRRLFEAQADALDTRAADSGDGGGHSIAGAGADDQGDRAFLVARFRDRPHAGRHVGDDLLAPHGMGVEQQEPSSSGLNDSCRHHQSTYLVGPEALDN